MTDFPGRTLQAGEKVLGHWFARGGDNAIFRAQLISAEVDAVTSAPVGTATIRVLTKNSEEQGDGAEITAAMIEFDGTNAVGDILEQLVISVDGDSAADGIMELLRFKVEVVDG